MCTTATHGTTFSSFWVPFGVTFGSFLSTFGVLGWSWGASGLPRRPKPDFSRFLRDFRVHLGVTFGVDFAVFRKNIGLGDDFGVIFGGTLSELIFVSIFHGFWDPWTRNNQAKP